MSAARGIAAVLVALLASAAALAEEVHGKTDIFAATGVALAWAVLRDPDEARTVVVIRVVTDPAMGALSVTGRDPFSKAEKIIMPPVKLARRMDVRITRTEFADFPRTELRFFATVPRKSDEKPVLEVYYLGVPDTTPEFNDAARMDAYLTERTRK